MYNGYYYGFDMTYLVLVVPALLIALIAQIQVKSAFSRYARVRCTSGLTGAQAAQRILQANGITDVRIEHISGKLTDHFDPQAKVIRLSDEVYGVASIAAVGVAAHEAGHAVVIHELDSQDPVHHITIVPRGQAGGMTISLPREDRAYLSKRELEERIAVCLGGRVAEQLVLNDISTGASSDIQKASQTARAMVTKYGMSERLGTIAYGNENDEVFIGRTMAQARTYSEEVAGQIDEEVKAIVDRAYARCEEILTRRRQELELTARYLLVHETMSGEIFQKVFTDPAAPELALPEEDQPAQEG